MSSQNILQQIKNSYSLLPASRDPPLHPTRSRRNSVQFFHRMLSSKIDLIRESRLMNITLKPEQSELIQQKLNSGKYSNVDEVIDEALQLLYQRDLEYETWVEETRGKVDVAIDELRRGEGIDGDVVIAQLKEKLHQARQSQP